MDTPESLYDECIEPIIDLDNEIQKVSISDLSIAELEDAFRNNKEGIYY